MKLKNDRIPDSVDIIDEHLEKFFDSSEITVLHEKKSEVVHVDIFIVKPNEERNYSLLLTCGMSALPMKAPKGIDNLQFDKITMLLPKGWNLNYSSFTDENNYWPVRALKQLAMYPHLNSTWFGYGHTIPLNDEHKVNHQFHSIILLDSITMPEEFTQIDLGERVVYFYSAIPIYREELDYQLEHGTEKLLELFEEYDIDEIVDINRMNVCE